MRDYSRDDYALHRGVVVPAWQRPAPVRKQRKHWLLRLLGIAT